jgi:hypothetical protein
MRRIVVVQGVMVTGEKGRAKGVYQEMVYTLPVL